MKNTWQDDSIQFPRLISEMEGLLGSQDDVAYLCTSMDISMEELRELLDRAQARWDQIKYNTTADGYDPCITNSYNRRMDPEVQLQAEEFISSTIFDTIRDYSEDGTPTEELCKKLGEDILAVLITSFRPDMVEKELPRDD